jgi:hypothetical protein
VLEYAQRTRGTPRPGDDWELVVELKNFAHVALAKHKCQWPAAAVSGLTHT